MRVVLYADDMEPITVVELTGFAVAYLEQHRRVRLPVMEMPSISARKASEIPDNAACRFRIVEIFAERMSRRGVEHMMLFTHNEESALLLKSAFLPGQQRNLQEREENAFAQGFLNALAKIGR